MSETYTIAEATRKLRDMGHVITYDQVRRMVKWYAVAKGIDDPDKLKRPNPRHPHSPHGYIYSLPKDFIDWAHNYLKEWGR